MNNTMPMGLGHHRRGSERRVAETGNLRDLSQSRSRRQSVERGARVAETGSLVRGREGVANSASVGVGHIVGAATPVIDEDETDGVDSTVNGNSRSGAAVDSKLGEGER